MPTLAMPMKPVCDTTFVGLNKKIPIDHKQPQGKEASDQYRNAFTTSEHMAVPEPNCYFWAASTNKFHVDGAKTIGTDFKDFCHKMLDGFKSAVDQWRLAAMFKSLIVVGPVCTGAPGCLSGPPLESLIKLGSLPAATGNLAKWRDAVAKGLSACFKDWQDMVTIPGMPFYPAFAVFPGPVGAPMPNVPMPMIAMVSGGMARMATPMLKSEMKNNFSLDDPDDQFGACAMAIATAVNAAFMAWLPSQQVMNCSGMGPIPTFAPPVAPAGPVAGGQNIPAPNLAA